MSDNKFPMDRIVADTSEAVADLLQLQMQADFTAASVVDKITILLTYPSIVLKVIKSVNWSLMKG